jgi:signal transduction histidine kinase
MDNLGRIFARVENKKRDYNGYNFTKVQDNALKTFFDLAQEYESPEEIYYVCVTIPKSYFGLEANLYLLDAKRDVLVLACSSDSGRVAPKERGSTANAKLSHEAFVQGASLFVPIRSKSVLNGVEEPGCPSNNLMGMLEIVPGDELEENERFYFQKFANRIGYTLSNKILTQRNIGHLRFINSLVADIEHNVIVPNMAFRLFLRRLNAKIEKSLEIEEMLRQGFVGSDAHMILDPSWQQQILEELQDANRGLLEEFSNIDQHHRNMSLFVESLFRRGHFVEGRFVPRKRSCHFIKEVMHPQLERFLKRFQSKGISVNNLLNEVDENSIVHVVDVGLISQVYANLFSNALKYTEPVVDASGNELYFVSIGREIVESYFGSGKDGVKFNVFSTGGHIPSEERGRIFEEGYRGSQVGNKPGTGHGLSFIKKVIEIHDGVVGYEPATSGNNFFFILPQ